MSLDTNTEVEEIQTVQDAQGDPQPPANAAEQDKTNARLGNEDTLTGFEYTTASTSAEQLPAHAVPHGTSVLIQAKPGNSSKVYVGNGSGQPVSMNAGASLSLDVTDTSTVYIRTPTSGDGVNVLYEG